MCERVRAERSKVKKYIYIYLYSFVYTCISFFKLLIIFGKVTKEEREKNFQK